MPHYFTIMNRWVGAKYKVYGCRCELQDIFMYKGIRMAKIKPLDFPIHYVNMRLIPLVFLNEF